MEDVPRQVADHSKECELLEMKKSLTRETPSQEEDNWVWGSRMQFEEIFSGFFDMESKDIRLCLGDEE